MFERIRSVGACLLAGIVVWAGAVDALAATEGPSPKARASNDAPSAAELEFWKSAERLNTAEAYNAYLSAYPNGFFAALARAALTKANVATAAPAADPSPSKPGEAKAAAQLKYFTERASSGAITFRRGARFVGPGPVTVGWAGAKKQVLLPSGEWVVLAAVDHKSGPVNMTTLVFGKFVGDRLASALWVGANRHGTTHEKWTTLDGCEASNPKRLHQWHRPGSPWRRECMTIVAQGKPWIAEHAATAEVRASLERMEAVETGMSITTAMYFADRSNGYMQIFRIDWPGVALGEAATRLSDWSVEKVASDETRSAYLRSLVAWAEAYRPHALDGFKRGLSQSDLNPGSTRDATAPALGVADFDPSSIRETTRRGAQ